MEELYKLPIILKELRLQHGYTLAKMGEMLGIRYQSYQAYELGIAVPSLQNFIKISKIYDVSLDYLIGESNV